MTYDDALLLNVLRRLVLDGDVVTLAAADDDVPPRLYVDTQEDLTSEEFDALLRFGVTDPEAWVPSVVKMGGYGYQRRRPDATKPPPPEGDGGCAGACGVRRAAVRSSVRRRQRHP